MAASGEENRPTAQAEQDEEAVLRAKRPPEHALQLAELARLNWPIGQVKGCAAPVTQAEPAGQNWQAADELLPA